MQDLTDSPYSMGLMRLITELLTGFVDKSTISPPLCSQIVGAQGAGLHITGGGCLESFPFTHVPDVGTMLVFRPVIAWVSPQALPRKMFLHSHPSQNH